MPKFEGKWDVEVPGVFVAMSPFQLTDKDEEEAIAKYGAWIVKFTIIETHLRMSSTVNLLEQSSKGPCHSSQPPRPWTLT